jgi:hypothetical protein
MFWFLLFTPPTFGAWGVFLFAFFWGLKCLLMKKSRTFLMQGG